MRDLPSSVDGVAFSPHPREHGSKGLEFPVVAPCGVGQMPGEGEDEKDEARLFYVAATRAMQRLAIAAAGDGQLLSS